MKRLLLALPLVLVTIGLVIVIGLGPAACDDDNSPAPPALGLVEPLTDGVPVRVAGCPFGVRTPAETTAPVGDRPRQDDKPPRSLHLSWAGDPSTSISIVWLTDPETRGTHVEFGPAGGETQRVSGFSFAYPEDLLGIAAPTVRVHEVHICGLTPGTTYRYRAGSDGAMSAEQVFHTAPAAGRPLRFAVAGDSRGDPATWGAILKGIASAGPDFLLYSGDAVSFGFVQQEWDAWFDAGKDVLPSLPLMFAWGNHEGAARHVAAQMALPGNEHWYSFDAGDVHFTALDDTPPIDATIEADQATFLDEDLGRTRRPWKVVTHHRAVFSSSAHGSDLRLQQAWMPIYDRWRVDLVLNGHDHVYERTHPLRGGAVVPDGEGTVYMVNGGGGAPLYGAGQNVFTAMTRSTYGYAIIDVAGEHMKITAWELVGGTPTKLDEAIIRHK